jgi:hypothetical protein
MRKIAITALSLVCGLGAATSAEAAGTKRIVVDSFVDEFEFAIDCGEFGPYDFDNLVSGVQRLRITEVVSSDGTLLQTVFHTQIHETDTNSRTGKRLPLRSAIREVWDYTTNLRTMTGAVFIGTMPGAGHQVQETGRIVMTLDTRVAQFVAGPHPAFFAGGIDPAVCAVLAG